MTQPGETDDFAVSDHIKTLMKYGGQEIVFNMLLQIME